MRILHVLSTSSFSGAENVVCQIISLFKDDSDFEMYYCSPNGQIKDILNEKGIRFCPISNKLTVGAIKKVIENLKPDIIHAHDMGASFKVALACKKTPFISQIHNNNFDSRGLSFKAIAYYFAAKKAKHIFWVSKNSFEGYAFHEKFKEKSSVLYNVIDMDELYKRVDKDANSYNYDVVYLGRITQLKDPYRLLKVCRILAEKKPDIKIAIIGTGDMEDEVRLKANDMKLLKNVFFLGFLSNPAKILHDSKTMIMTSSSEGTPMCALEAMALGVPIVSTPVGGLNELVVDGVNGFLSYSDEVLANKIFEIVTNKDLLHDLSNGQKKYALMWNDKKKYSNILKTMYMTLL